MQSLPYSKAKFDGKKTSFYIPCPIINVSGKVPQSQYLSKAFQTDATHYLISRNEVGIHYPSDAKDIFVLQLGSRWLRFGRSTDALPHQWPMSVAIKRQSNSKRNVKPHPCSPILQSLPPLLAPPEKMIKISQEQKKLNSSSKPQTMSSINDSFAIEWTPEPEDDSITIMTGPSILHLREENWSLECAIIRGKIVNLKYLELIIGDSLRKVYNLTHYKESSIILVLDDCFCDCTSSIISLCQLILEKMSFLSMNIIPSSVSSCIGTNSSGGLVFDFGCQTSSISLVEDCQIILKENLLIGGDDLVHVLGLILKEGGSSLQLDHLYRPIHFEILEELRERITMCDDKVPNITPSQSPSRHEVFERDPSNNDTIIHNIYLKDEALFLGNFLFLTNVSHPLKETSNPMVITCSIDSTSFDLEALEKQPSSPYSPLGRRTLDDFNFSCLECDFNSQNFDHSLKHLSKHHYNAMVCSYNGCQKISTSLISKHCHISDHLFSTVEKRELDSLSSDPSVGADAGGLKCITDSLVDLLKSMEYVIGKEDSVEAVEQGQKISNERITKALSSIILTGGLSQSPGIKERIISIIDELHPDKDIIFSSSDLFLSPSMISWKGGSVLARMDLSIKNGEGWISSRDWAMCGARVLRERLSFQLK